MTSTRISNSTKPSFFLSGQLGRLLDRWQPPANIVLLGTALIVGILTGIGAVAFRYLIDGVTWVGYTWFPDITPGWGKAFVFIIPATGGLLVGLLVYYFAREAKGHGVPEVMEAVALRGGRIRPRVAVIKSLASSICIGSGGSAGREGPIVQIGSAVGSTLGQVLNLSDDRIANLVACGSAAGIAATFNAPIAGVVFALEIILGRFSVRNFSTVVVAAVSASIIGRMAFGDFPAFSIPFEYGINSLWEFLFYTVLGIIAALVGVLYTRALYWSEDRFESLKLVPEWFKPSIGGILLGLLAVSYPLLRFGEPLTWERMPHVYNVGYDIIESVLANQLTISVVAILLVAKIIATCLTLGSGGSGGIFAPSLFMGAMMGAAFELAVNRLFPGVSAPSGAYALVGMAAVFAACAHAPMTATLILFELTGDYRIILPLMLTVVIATVLSQRLLKGESIYTLKLTRRGIRLRRGRDIDILQGVEISEVMTQDYESIPADMDISRVANVFANSHHHGLMVLDDSGKLAGLVTLTDLERAMMEKLPPDTPVKQIATRWPHLVIAYPDETMGDALERMGSRGLGRLPVVSREDPYQLAGLIWREGIIEAYNLALTRRMGIQQQTRHLERQFEEDTEFVTIPISSYDPVAGSTIAKIAPRLPKDCVIVSIKRNGKILIPHGDTQILPGDLLTAFIHNKDAEQLFLYIHQGPDGEQTASNGKTDVSGQRESFT